MLNKTKKNKTSLTKHLKKKMIHRNKKSTQTKTFKFLKNLSKMFL